MAYPASTELLSKALDQLDGLMLMIKSLSADLRTRSAAGSIPASAVTDYLSRVAGFRARLVVLAATPGLGAYAQAQKSLPGLDVTVEYTNTLAQIDGTRAWIITNFPKNAQGDVQTMRIGIDGILVIEGTITGTFTSVQLAGLRTQLSALEATIA